MPATGAGSDDRGARRGGADVLDERFGDLERELILLAQRAEGAGHAAAAAVQQGDLPARQPQRQAPQHAGIHQRFHMTVRVNEHLAGARFKPQRHRFGRQ